MQGKESSELEGKAGRASLREREAADSGGIFVVTALRAALASAAPDSMPPAARSLCRVLHQRYTKSDIYYVL